MKGYIHYSVCAFIWYFVVYSFMGFIKGLVMQLLGALVEEQNVIKYIE